MKTDRIFVLLLVVMLPMSGCFDDGVGDAEAADDTDEGTTVINNYYYNNTTIIESEESQPTEFFTVGRTLDVNDPSIGFTMIGTTAVYTMHSFSTVAGQTVYVHLLKSNNPPHSVYLESDCGGGGNWSYGEIGGSSSYWVPGSAFDCEHSIQYHLISPSGPPAGFTQSPPYYYSAIYSIENMTVIA